MIRSALVTGGAGFIGSHLAEALAKAGTHVRVFDNLDTGKRTNLAGFDDRVEFVRGDVTDAAALAAACRGMDAAFHLAAMVSVPQSVREPERCHAVCATGTLNLLLGARAAGVRRVVYAGTSAAYGRGGAAPISETAPLDPLSPYAAAKLAGELYCQTFAALGDLETVRLRFFNVYGPRQDPASAYSGVISIFADKARKGEPATIHGDGLQTRDFVHVSDVVAALRSAGTTPGVSGGVFNLGRGTPLTLLDLHAAVNAAANANLPAAFGPPRAGDVRHSCADIAAARRGLGFAPAVDLATGLAGLLGKSA